MVSIRFTGCDYVIDIWCWYLYEFRVLVLGISIGSILIYLFGSLARYPSEMKTNILLGSYGLLVLV